MQYLKRFRFLVTVLSLVGLFSLTLSWQRVHSQAQATDATDALEFDASAVVHGFATAPGLPDGDLFLLPRPLRLLINRPPASARLMEVNADSFGDEPVTIGALPNVPARGFSLVGADETVQALTCAESIWDGNLILAATAGAQGDVVRVFLQYADGTGKQELLLMTAEAEGFRLTGLHSQLKLYVDNRFALGPDTPKGSLLPFVDEAGQYGRRTGLLTFAFPMDHRSPLHGCFQMGIEITRAHSAGMTTVVVPDIVVNRNRVAGDENNSGTGLLGGLNGGYPSGLPCNAECPTRVVTPTPTPTPAPTPECNECKTLCFRSPQHYYLMFCTRPETIPFGTVLIGGVNFNRPVPARSTPAAVAMRSAGLIPLQQLNKEFVAAQLSVLLAGGEGSANIIATMEGRLYCYDLDFAPLTLSNGFILSPQSKLKDLFAQARASLSTNHDEDMTALARIFDLLNGNSTLGTCHR
jgi:hypothetical protein